MNLKLGGQMGSSCAVVRILLVEDYEFFRVFVRSLLEENSKFLIIGEATDGKQAVEKVAELRPDLILLDVGLPKLNGIKAAREIREISPTSKILFVSENRSWDIVQKCLDTGAHGYVVKSSAGSDLLPAIREVLQGNQFVTASLDFSGGKEGNNAADCKDSLTPLPPINIPIRHEVEFYSDDAALVNGFTCLMQAALNVGNVAIVVATESHRRAILQRLRSAGVDVDAAMEQGRCIQLDAREALAKMMVADAPDPARCTALIDNLIRKATKGANGNNPRISICGECAPTLLADGNAEAAVLLEHLWDENTRRYDADTLCGYLQSAVPREESTLILERICAEHSAVHGRALGF